MRATLTVLGSGTSMGVPTIGCDCRVCTSDDPRDRRTRPSIMVQWEGRTVLIDTTPDFREQAIREGIRRVDAILYTHGHADHILGLDDVRPLSYPRITGGGKIPLFASDTTERVLRSVFRYIFDGDYKYGGLAQVEIHPVSGPRCHRLLIQIDGFRRVLLHAERKFVRRNPRRQFRVVWIEIGLIHLLQ